jgi:hypothetical protein
MGNQLMISIRDWTRPVITKISSIYFCVLKCNRGILDGEVLRHLSLFSEKDSPTSWLWRTDKGVEEERRRNETDTGRGREVCR